MSGEWRTGSGEKSDGLLLPALCSRGPTSDSQLRSGFTLIEVLLVLALLVVVAAIAAPSLSAGSAQTQMKRAAEQVRTSWAEARLDAVSSGETRKFQCRVGAGIGYVSPANATAAEIDGAIDKAAEATPAAASSSFQLSAIVFRELLVASQPGSPPVGGGVADGDLSAAVFFRPDGTTSDAEVLLEDNDGRRLKVTLRGVTGSASVEEVLDGA